MGVGTAHIWPGTATTAAPRSSLISRFLLKSRAPNGRSGPNLNPLRRGDVIYRTRSEALREGLKRVTVVF